MFYPILAGLFGLCIGSFLNVVIYRLPRILKNQWRLECLEFLNQSASQQPENLSLAFPRSHCPLCKTTIPFWHNLPLLSFILLGGKCSHCHAKIALHYPIVELLSALLTSYAVYQFGLSWQTAGALILTWCLLALVFIDLQQKLLPDQITLPLVWLGLLWNLHGQFVPLSSAVIGAIAGYCFMWSIAWIFRKVRKIEGMGYGDFKLTAALGAWLGWQFLPLLVITASLLGTIFGVTQLLIKKQSHLTPIPFGPYLAVAGWITLFWGEQILHRYWLLLT